MIALLSLLALLATIIIFVSYEYFTDNDLRSTPIAGAVEKALETEDVNYILLWVDNANQMEVKDAFQQALTARKFIPEAREFVDRNLIEKIGQIYRMRRSSARAAESKSLLPIS
jgi:hypothetical protein